MTSPDEKPPASPPEGEQPAETPAEQPEETPAEQPEETPAERRRRLEAVFGDVLPETTRDEREDGGPSGDGTDAWLRDQVPPHHG